MPSISTILRALAAFLASGALVGLQAAKDWFVAHAPAMGADVSSWIMFALGAGVIAGVGWLIKRFGPTPAA